MEPLFNQIIPEQGFEKVRDTIGAIIFFELTNQKRLGAFSEGFRVDIERTIPATSEEDIQISVHLANATYGTMTQHDAQGRTVYFVDFDASAEATDKLPGSYISAQRLHRFMGMVAYIFRSAQYRTLTHPGLIGGTYVEQFDTLDPNRKEDSDYTTFARLQIAVRIQENAEAWQARPLLGNNTTVKLDLTEKGYKFVFDN